MRTRSPESHGVGTSGGERPRVTVPLLPSPVSALRRDWPPPLRLLLGEAAGDIWATVLDTAGGRLRGLRVTSTTLQPDGAAVVQYAAEVGWAEGRTALTADSWSTHARRTPSMTSETPIEREHPMSNRPATWKVVTFGAALAGLGVAGAGAGAGVADDEPRDQQPDSVVVDAAAADATATPADASPESADSPNESVTDSSEDTPDADAPGDD